MSKPIKIGFMPLHNPYSRNTFSGTLNFMLRALQRHPQLEVKVLGGFKKPWPSLIGRVFRRDEDPFKFIPEEYEDIDAVVAPIASTVIVEHGHKIDKPIILVTDATPKYLRENYTNFPIADNAEQIEAQALARTNRILYSSQFMADLAREEFSFLADRPLDVGPFGINVDELPQAVAKKAPLTPLRLLFIGKDWERKGGNIALRALDVLLSRGIDAHMSTIGGIDEGAKAHSNVSVLGYLDKTRANESKHFDAALREAHLLVLPTRADCTPMVVAEANSFGCPVAITDVGGVGSLVESGVNGQMLDYDATPEEWADAIMALTVENNSYADMSASSYDYAMAHLSWDAWAQRVADIATEEARG